MPLVFLFLFFGFSPVNYEAPESPAQGRLEQYRRSAAQQPLSIQVGRAVE